MREHRCDTGSGKAWWRRKGLRDQVYQGKGIASRGNSMCKGPGVQEHRTWPGNNATWCVSGCGAESLGERVWAADRVSELSVIDDN